MQECSFRAWLERRAARLGLKDKTIRQCVTDARRVECCYSDLDSLYETDRLDGLLQELSGPENTSRIPVSAPSLSSYKAAVVRYQEFCDGTCPSRPV